MPDEILDLKSKLRSLDISFNRIELLPDSIGQFTSLRTLSLNNNKLGEEARLGLGWLMLVIYSVVFLAQVPPSLGDLNRLETLYLQWNTLSSVPGSLASLTSLKTLDMSHNQLQSFPPSLYSLPHLDYLNLSHNHLHSLPVEGVENLHTMEVNLSSNSLPCLPAGLGKCKRLKVLRVEENCLELAGFPWELLEHSKVSLLCLDGNLIQQKDLQGLKGYQQVCRYVSRYVGV